MKKLLMFLGAAILLAACKGNGDNKTNESSKLEPVPVSDSSTVNGDNKTNESSKLELDTVSDSLTVNVGECTIEVGAKVTYPTNVEPIKKDLMELVKQIAQEDNLDGNSEALKTDATDMRSLLSYLLKSKAECMKADFVEGAVPDNPMYYNLEVKVLEETDKYITMGVTEDLMFNGPHPQVTSYGITYLKPDGKKVELSDLNTAKTAEIKKELFVLAKNYFTELTKGDDVYLGLNEEEFDMPRRGIYLQDGSVVFAYQIDELVSYAFGMPEVNMSLKQMQEKGWLGKSLSDLAE